ncbi:MAG: hypothetical protein EA380_07620 [Phycisphaeraceae bacterium]|nr:MAG: hypothetical protein EA380_07620 [Phycisphaeraceae bacterium]
MNDATLLLRQVNPSWIQQGRVTSQAFRPTPKDDFKLSVYDGDLITPTESWKHFTESLCFQSVGTLAVTVAECSAQDLSVRPDPEPFREHAVVDFTDLGTNQIEKKSKKLNALAAERGWLYQPEAN